MDVMNWFSINNILVNIPLGEGGYPLSWIEAVGTIAGLLCIWLFSIQPAQNHSLCSMHTIHKYWRQRRKFEVISLHTAEFEKICTIINMNL